MTDTYERAYTEIYEILKYIPKEEYNKIPKEKIDFFYKNKDKEYIFKYDVSKKLKEQNVSRKTASIIVYLYMQYFSTPEKNEKIKKILIKNENIYQKKLSDKYGNINIFDKNKERFKINSNLEIAKVEKKENFIKKIINLIISKWKKNYTNRR